MKSLAKIRKHCLAKPDTTEDEPWPGHAAWRVRGKIFAIMGEQGEDVTVKSTLEKQAALVLHPAISKAGYVGRFGWVTIALEDADTLGLSLDLIDEAYEMVGPKRKAATGPNRPPCEKTPAAKKKVAPKKK